MKKNFKITILTAFVAGLACISAQNAQVDEVQEITMSNQGEGSFRRGDHSGCRSGRNSDTCRTRSNPSCDFPSCENCTKDTECPYYDSHKSHKGCKTTRKSAAQKAMEE